MKSASSVDCIAFFAWFYIIYSFKYDKKSNFFYTAKKKFKKIFTKMKNKKRRNFFPVSDLVATAAAYWRDISHKFPIIFIRWTELEWEREKVRHVITPYYNFDAWMKCASLWD